MLHWMAEVTRTFEIHRIPGNLSYNMQTVEAEDQQVVRTGGAGSGGGGSNTGVRATPQAGGSIFLQSGSGAGFWEHLSDTLQRLLARPAVRPPSSTGLPAPWWCAARREGVREAGRHIDALNAWLARQVLLEIQLVTVKMGADNTMGIDWQVVGQKAGSLNPTIASTFADDASRATGATLGTFGFVIDPGIKPGNDSPPSLGGRLADHPAGALGPGRDQRAQRAAAGGAERPGGAAPGAERPGRAGRAWT